VRHGRTDGSYNVGARLDAGASLSGRERNHLFLNQSGDHFVDLSGISGADSPADGRAFALLDFDRDGWQDLAVVNANAPLFELYRNQMGDGSSAAMLALRFVGGNGADQPSQEWSARDGYGAAVTIDLAPGTIIRQHRAGEGFSAQNSPVMRIGLGNRSKVASLEVRWPSGKVQNATDVPARTLVTVYENEVHSPTGEAFVFSPY
jgi:hypothetical protein